MWTADANDIVPLRDGTGKPFTGFVDSLIRTHGFVYGVGEADIRTNLRTNYPDGGVDTQVCLAMHGDPTGYLTLPTCWQFKAWSYREIDDAYLSKEVHKAFAAKLIAEGYAYRFAICAEMPPEKQAEWETLLTAAARSINPQAPEARVASASQLAYWANRYPPLLFAQCGIDPGPVFYFEAWKKNATKTTPIFVAVDEWRQKDKRIRSHIDFSQPVKSPVITLQGMAGVGKTRLAYEILASLAGAHNLVFYTTDGSDAEVVARFLANNSRTRGVLVADECPLLSRARIEEGLKGHTDRIRVVCIDNSGERMGGNEELWLEELSPPAVEKVLAENFSRVPADRRRVYAAQSGGYVRLAAVLCEHDVEIQSTGHFDPALVVIHEQYRKWLPEERQQKAVAAISLVQRVGFGEGVQEELEALCVFTGQERNGVLEVVAALKDAPGFVAQTTRYLYVTPEIIARAAFARAWKRWFQSDPADALRRLPPVLLSSFLARVALSASPEVRALTGQFFWDSVASMQPSDLADEDLTDRLTALVETQPDRYFPRLALLVRQSTPGQLRESKGGLRGGRRTLVWAAERLAAFPTHFCEAEEILRRLALAETEDGIGNNATGIWKQMFRIVLSGAATPFRERIGLLGRLIFSTDPEESRAAGQAHLLHRSGRKRVGARSPGSHVGSHWHALRGPFGNCGPTCPARLEAQLHRTISRVPGTDPCAVRQNL
ncbi:hypothetical protein SBA4_1900009 [Candidatus Sulfopaludibacter sp. SbA4]|nr:hypothetical protein SBA4_1900009 [Candidatus Sulfopaludibacter sp. SbA4]